MNIQNTNFILYIPKYFIAINIVRIINEMTHFYIDSIVFKYLSFLVK